MSKDDILRRVCGLCELVMNSRFKCKEPADCFCGMKPYKAEDFRFSERVLSYIERAVKERLQEDAKKENVVRLAEECREAFRDGAMRGALARINDL